MDGAVLPEQGSSGEAGGKKLGTRLFMAVRFRDDELTAEDADFMEQVFLAERMHWTLEYVQSLDPAEFYAVQEILRARDEAVKPMSKIGEQ